jgi:hypothetical protein
LAFVADFGTQNFNFKNKFDMEHKTSLNLENGNDANRLLAVRFISENIIVDRFPVSKEIKAEGKHNECQVIINVSDEFYLGNSEEIMKEGKLNYGRKWRTDGFKFNVWSIASFTSNLYLES